MEATSATSMSSEDYTEQQETSTQDTKKEDKEKDKSKNWNPSKSQRILRFEGEEIKRLQEVPQIGRWSPPGKSGLNDEHVRFLAKDIAKNGQRQPVGCKKGPSGDPLLFMGRHRKAAILLINEDPSKWEGPLGTPLSDPLPLLYIYQNLSDEEAIDASIKENTGLPLSVVDLAATAAKLDRVLGYSNDRIAEILSTPHHRVSPTRVIILKSYMRLPLAVLVKLHNKSIPESAAKAMLALKLDGPAMEEMASELEKGNIKAGQIIAMEAEESRKRGRKRRRSIKDVYELLGECDTADSDDFKSWLDGEHNNTERVMQIFTRCEDEQDGEIEEAKGSNLVGDGWELMEDDGETQLYMKGGKVKRVRKS